MQALHFFAWLQDDVVINESLQKHNINAKRIMEFYNVLKRRSSRYTVHSILKSKNTKLDFLFSWSW